MDGRTDESDGRSGPTTRPAFAKATQVKKVISQLRLGYTLNEYRYKIGLQESPLCSCGAIETVDHYICECEVYELDRQKLLT